MNGSRSFAGGGGSGSDATKVPLYTTQSKTASFTAAPGFVYLVDSTAGAVTVTLPAANVAGQQLAVKWMAGANNVTVQRAGSDTIGAATTSANMGLLNEVWEFLSSGAGQWNLIGGNKTLSSLDDRYAPDWLTTGEEVIHRRWVTSNSSAPMTSGTMRLTFFTARKSETTTQLRFPSGNTAAGATPTLCRAGLYTVAANGDGTLVASIPNDTTLYSIANTTYTRSWSTPYNKVAGQRYALGFLVVTAATVPQMCSNSMNAVNEPATAPRLSAGYNSLSDLPSSFTDAALATTGTSPYGVILP